MSIFSPALSVISRSKRMSTWSSDSIWRDASMTWSPCFVRHFFWRFVCSHAKRDAQQANLPRVNAN